MCRGGSRAAATSKMERFVTIANGSDVSELCLLYQCLPIKTYHLSGEKCSGGKNSKVRLAGMTATSATGE